MLVLSSKYIFEFDITFEFNVIQRQQNANSNIRSFVIKIVNDDPLVIHDDLRRDFFLVDDDLEANKLIGAIDLFELLNVEQHVVNLKHKLIHLDFMLENDMVTPNRNLFMIDKRTGLVFTKARIMSKQTKLFKLNVRVKGMIDETKMVLFRVDVYVHIQSKPIVTSQLEEGNFNEIILHNLEATFSHEQNMVNLVLDESKTRHQIQRRFKIIHQQVENVCVSNWYSSSLMCGLKVYFCSIVNDGSTFYQLQMIAYDFETFNLVNLINVKIYSNRTECGESLTQEIELVREIQVNWSNNDRDKEQSLGIVYEMLREEQGLKLNTQTYRILYDDDAVAHEVSNRIFKINSESSELKVIKSMIGNKTAANFSLLFKVVKKHFLNFFPQLFALMP
jgi:hypothetical protein